MSTTFRPETDVVIGYELKRLIDAVIADTTEDFDVYENDIFILCDPEDDVEFDIDDILGEEDKDVDTDDPDLIDELLSADEMCEENVDEDDDIPVDIEEFLRFVDIDPSTANFFEELAKEQNNLAGFDLFEEQPNFYHKSSGLKLWWRIGDGLLYSNQPITLNFFRNIVNQCIISLGRRTRRYIITHHLYEDWYNAIM